MRSLVGCVAVSLSLGSACGLDLESILNAESLDEFASPNQVLRKKLDAVQERRQLTNPYWPEPPEGIQNYINFASVSRQYTQLTHFLTGSQSMEQRQYDGPEPTVESWGGSKVKMGKDHHFCIPCGKMFSESLTQAQRVEECKEIMTQVQSFQCKFGSATTEVPPFLNVTDCAAWLQQARCEKNEKGFDVVANEIGNAAFHLHREMGNTLQLTCPIPAVERKQLQAGSPIKATLVQDGNSYQQRTVYPHEPSIPEVPMTAVLYYNLVYRNNAELLPEWFNYAMMQVRARVAG